MKIPEIDSVRPKKTFYTLEPMPWMLPDTAESYLELIRAIDRPAFAVHMDMVNLINDPKKYLFCKFQIDHTFDLLGSYIKSCHLNGFFSTSKSKKPMQCETCTLHRLFRLDQRHSGSAAL